MKARTTIQPVIPPDYKNMHNRLCDPAEHNLTHFKLLQFSYTQHKFMRKTAGPPLQSEEEMNYKFQR
jgi:hypothetical protein